MNSKLLTTASAVLLSISAGSAAAVDNVSVNGFLTVGAAKSDWGTEPSGVATQDGLISDDIGFDQDTRVGIQVSAEINPRIGLTAQLIGRSREDGYDARFDWGYVDYKVNDQFNVRAGKLKMPTFLISDYYEVGYAYPWIRPPEEVYSSNPLTAITGVDFLFRTHVGDIDVLVQPYLGTSTGEETVIPQEALAIMAPTLVGTVQTTGFSAKDMIGLNVSAGTEVFTVRAGYLQTKVDAADFGVFDDKATFASLGATVDWNNVLVYSEYFEREIEGAANMAFPNQKGWYGTFGYRMGKALPHLTFAKLEDNDNPNPAAALEQKSTTLGLRYELGAGADVKFEYQRVKPEGRGLFIADPGDDVNIISVALDVVF